MKKIRSQIFITLLFVIGTFNIVKAQSSDFVTYTIYCENISTEEASNAVKNYFLTNYAARIKTYEPHLDEKSAFITCNVNPIDLLQLYRQQGYSAIYISSEGRFHLNDGGEQMIWIKE